MPFFLFQQLHASFLFLWVVGRVYILFEHFHELFAQLFVRVVGIVHVWNAFLVVEHCVSEFGIGHCFLVDGCVVALGAWETAGFMFVYEF